METVHGAPSFQLSTPELTLNVTEQAGHLAPVTFHLPGLEVSPYALAPWLPEEHPELPPLLSVLRGDFLCLPFGGQVTGPPHGDTANAKWSLISQDETSLHLSISTADSDAQVEKILSTRSSHHAIYIEHRISNLSGNFSYGNHPIFDLSTLPAGHGRISTSPFRWASVYPDYFSNPADGASQALEIGSRFSDLSSVKLAAGGTTDLSCYPARAGNDDLVMMVNAATTSEQPFAWSAIVLDGFVWFSLKNPADFPATMLWFSNGGRSASPWNSRHIGRLGIEEVCSHFCDGIDISREDRLAADGIQTARHFSPSETVSLRILQAAALVPEGFGAVTRIVPHGESAVILTGQSGAEITVALDWQFVL